MLNKSIKVAVETKELIDELSKAEKRTIKGFVDRLVYKEYLRVEEEQKINEAVEREAREYIIQGQED